MSDRVEFYLDKKAQPFCSVASSFQPNDGDLVNIKKVTYVVLGRSFTVDTDGFGLTKMRCNVIVEKVK